MGYRLKKTIVMVGMMGAGKTAIGAALARRLQVPFIDSDAEIELAANRSVAEIFERDGEEFFRNKETQVIERLLQGQRSILSTGGGAFLADRNRELIERLGVSVWLKADLELLWQRVRHKDSRPLLRTPDPYGTLAALMVEREPIYAQATLSVQAAPDLSIPDMVKKVMGVLTQHPEILEVV
ncbi:MAG: shikimate kinase [Pseudomonadota bacterium]